MIHPEKVILEISRVLKIDGVVAFHPWLYEKSLFKDYARKNDKPHVIYLHSSGKWKKVEEILGWGIT